MEIGLLILRAFLGALLVGHASQKLFGIWSGHGIAGTAPLFEMWGLKPGRPLVAFAGIIELAAGLMLILGFITPLASAGAIGTMAVASFVNAPKGLWAVAGGYELPLTYGVMAAGLAFTGAGPWSLDAALGWDFGGPGVRGVAAVAVALILAAGFILHARRHQQAAAREESADV